MSLSSLIIVFVFCRNPGDVLETFNFLENADDSDEEENDMIEDIAEGKEKHRINKKHKVNKCLSLSALLIKQSTVLIDMLIVIVV